MTSSAGAGRIYRLVSLLAAMITVLLLADQLLDGRIRRWLEAELDGRARRRARSHREGFTPGAELVIARAEEILEEEAARHDD